VPTTPVASLRYASLSDPPNANTLSQNLATDLDHVVVPKYTNSAARDAANPSPQEGDLCVLTNTQEFLRYANGSWGTHDKVRRIHQGSLGATQSFSSSTFANVTGMSWSVTANSWYEFYMHVTYGAKQTGSPAPGIKIQFTGPAGSTLTCHMLALSSTVTGASTGDFWGTVRGYSSQALGSPDDNTSQMGCEIFGYLLVAGTAGTLQLQAAQVNTNAGATNNAIIYGSNCWGKIQRVD